LATGFVPDSLFVVAFGAIGAYTYLYILIFLEKFIVPSVTANIGVKEDDLLFIKIE